MNQITISLEYLMQLHRHLKILLRICREGLMQPLVHANIRRRLRYKIVKLCRDICCIEAEMLNYVPAVHR